MSAIETRYAIAVAALLAVAAVPTVIHSYMDTTASDGRSTSAIPMRLAEQAGTATARRAGWGEDRFSSSDWIERRYAGAPEVNLFVGRSLDAKRLYHHPELALAYGQNYGPSSVTRLPQAPEIPVHVLRGADANSRRVALYTLRYDDEYVENPVRFQLRTSIELLFSRRKPMTLFFVTQDLLAGDQEIGSSRGATLLLAAMRAFEQQPAER